MSVEILDSYEVIQQEELSGIRSKGTLLRHKKSGARVILMENDDPNKVFSIAFKTPPSDSTGAPHIMEHSVLCGSKNFPAKDPFVELVKGSLNTFLNAMTYPDKTVFPVASLNDQDFQNLMHVYMDAVFYPNIYEHEEIFRQEGWSYELTDPKGELSLNGVVYNEMKGAFSSPEGVIDRMTLNTLFPDTAYAYESGGDPREIPDLTYEEFLDFHRTYYHPSNSYIYLYGKMDMEEKLQWLDEEYLCHFEDKNVKAEIGFQPPFPKMKEREVTYAISSEEPMEENTYLSYNKVIGTSLDKELYLAFEILDYVLLSSPGAVLKKALIDAGIGKDILGSYDNGLQQPMFTVVAKNAEADQKEAFVDVIEGTLKDLVKNGIHEDTLMAAINSSEFRYREADFGSYPKGLMYGLEILDSWLYDENAPFLHVDALPTYAFLKAQVGTRYYEDLIEKYLLDNPHGAIVVFKPERGKTARMEEDLKEKLSAYKKSLSPEEVADLVEKTKELDAYQSAPEREEDLKKIPMLTRADLSREIEPILNEPRTIGGLPGVFHETWTNEIGYLTLLFDLSGIRQEELPYVGVLLSVLGLLDTENYTYGELFDAINLETGGIGGSLEVYSDVTRVEEKAFTATLEIKGKALYEKLPVVTEMMTEILTRSKLTDTKRIREILDMGKSQLMMKFTSAGHSTAVMRSMSYSSPQSKFRDMTEGIDFYRLISDLLEHYEEKKGAMVEKLEALAKRLFTPDHLTVSFTASREGLSYVEDGLGKLKEALYPDTEKEMEALTLHCEKKNEGFKTASEVQYVARTGNFIEQGCTYTGALRILRTILNYEYLWQNIRVKDGAYGCMSNFSRTGQGYMVSYRDPHLKETLQIYEGLPDYLRSFTVSDRDMTKYIIGTLSEMDTPMTPSAKGERSMHLYMNHVDAERIQKERDQVLDAEEEDIRALSGIAEAVLQADELCVIGGEAAIEENADVFETVTSF